MIEAVGSIFFAAVVSAAFTWVVLVVSHRNHWYDRQDFRKVHTEATPRLGGVAIVLSASLVLTVTLSLVWEPTAKLNLLRLMAVTGGLLLFHLSGVIDDFVDLRAPIKLTLQLVAATALAMGAIGHVHSIISAEAQFWLVALLGGIALVPWFVGLSNAVNLVDGLDGLAGGILVIGTLGVLISGVRLDSQLVVLVAGTLSGSIVGFLVHNKPTASIFMGDGGSMFLGASFAAIPILGSSVEEVFALANVVAAGAAVPVVDTGAAIIRRLLSGRSVAAPDREHIHHQLIDRGWRVYAVLSVLYALTAFGVVTAALLAPLHWGLGAIVVAASWLVTAGVFAVLRRRGRPSGIASTLGPAVRPIELPGVTGQRSFAHQQGRENVR